MRTGAFVLAAWLATSCALAPRPLATQPNVIVFLVDDLGWQDLSEPFHVVRSAWNDRYRTPNVERLCRQGMKFSAAHAHPVCSPTRVSLMTGMAAARHKVTHWTLLANTPTDPERHALHRPEWHCNGLTNDASTPRATCADTLPSRMAARGYHTILVGKAHFGAAATPGADPLQLGFAENIAGHAAGAPSSYLAKQGFLRTDGDAIWQVPGLAQYHGSERFLSDVLTDEALAAAERARVGGKPFFLYLSHYAVHTPLDADERFVQRYRDQGLPEAEARYAALVEGMDHSLGRVLDWLDAAQLADDTIVLFTSDNGGLSASSRAGVRHTHNTPLRSGKGSIYEGGVRIPLAVRWPRRVAADTVSTQPVQVEDIMPTLCELVGAEATVADGVSIAGTLLAGAPVPHALFFHHPHYWGSTGPGIEPCSAVIDGDLKLIWFYSSQRAELYDLAHDLGETRDLAGTQPEAAARLRTLLRLQLARCAAQVPTSADGQPLAGP